MTTLFCLSLGLALLGAVSLAQAAFMAPPRDLEATGYPFYLFLAPSFALAVLLATLTLVRWRGLTKARRWAGLGCIVFAPLALALGSLFDVLFYGK